MKTKSWYAHGKLLITGEYLVLEGAKALALPLKFGQYLSLKVKNEKTISWNAMKPDGFWFQTVCNLPDLSLIHSTDHGLCERLRAILFTTRTLAPDFLNGDEGYDVETILEFDPDYGFGSSSTLITNIAKWANVDPFELQKLTFGGSGYDIACATLKDPIIYQLVDNLPTVEHVKLDFDFTDQVYFVYLGEKQRSTESIKEFKQKSKFSKQDIAQVNAITREIIFCKTLDEFERLLKAHELLLSKILKRKRVQSLMFPNHKGVVKSLGGWGGDFVLMTYHSSREEFEKYLKQKGFETYYRFNELVL